jgi:hypothetical protein
MQTAIKQITNCVLICNLVIQQQSENLPQPRFTVTKAYGELTAAIQALLLRDGLTPNTLGDKSLLVTVS